MGDFFQGKKTYLGIAIAAAVVVFQVVTGEKVTVQEVTQVVGLVLATYGRAVTLGSKS